MLYNYIALATVLGRDKNARRMVNGENCGCKTSAPQGHGDGRGFGDISFAKHRLTPLPLFALLLPRDCYQTNGKAQRQQRRQKRILA
jgi:hypothetical protein